uniref:Uncharacterized protein n=1 Tax=Aegilops tauschii TaxID=37682 RepID=M8B1L0_AEGTA
MALVEVVAKKQNQHSKMLCQAKVETPPTEWVQICVDAAFLCSGDSGWGVYSKEEGGEVIFTDAGRLACLTDALHAESLAMINAIRFVEEFGMGQVIFIMVCLLLKLALGSVTWDHAPLGILFREAKFKLQMDFVDYKIDVCSHLCNIPAHLLAGCGSTAMIDSQCIWFTNLRQDINA